MTHDVRRVSQSATAIYSDKGVASRTTNMSRLCRVALRHGQRLERQPAGAVAELVDADADLVEQRDEQVRHRRVERVLDVIAGLERAGQLARHQRRQIGMAMQVP